MSPDLGRPPWWRCLAALARVRLTKALLAPRSQPSLHSAVGMRCLRAGLSSTDLRRLPPAYNVGSATQNHTRERPALCARAKAPVLDGRLGARADCIECV